MRCMQHPKRKTYARGRCESCYRAILRREAGKKDSVGGRIVRGRLLLPHSPKWRWKQRKHHEVPQPREPRGRKKGPVP